MKLNCDLGESYGAWQMGQDERVMPLIDTANVACGFHAADPMVIRRTLALAAEHGVEVGAHPVICNPVVHIAAFKQPVCCAQFPVIFQG
jgi:lactam utilization protein B